MSDAISTIILNAQLQRSETLGAAIQYYNPQTTFNSSMTYGTASSLVNEGTTVSSSVVAAASKTWDLYGSSAGDHNLTGISGIIVFTKIRVLIIKNLNTTSGQDLLVGGAAATAWEKFVGDVVGGKISVPASGILVMQAPIDGWAVDNTHKLLKLDAVAGTVSFEMQVVGVK